MQLLKLSKQRKKYKSNLLYKKIREILYSKEFISSIQELAQDPEGDSAIHLPDEDEFVLIIKKAVKERLYDPFVLLEKRVL